MRIVRHIYMKSLHFTILLGLSWFVAAVVQADDKTKANDLVTPEMTDEIPAAGRRVRQVAPEYKGTEVYHAFYLPVAWKPGDVLWLMGGIDVRLLYTNDRGVIDRELESKIPVVMGHNGYVLHSDHSIPNDVQPENYEYFLQRGLELGTYK